MRCRGAENLTRCACERHLCAAVRDKESCGFAHIVRIRVVGCARGHALMKINQLRSHSTSRACQPSFTCSATLYSIILLYYVIPIACMYDGMPTPEPPKTLDERTCPKHAADADVACGARLPRSPLVLFPEQNVLLSPCTMHSASRQAACTFSAAFKVSSASQGAMLCRTFESCRHQSSRELAPLAHLSSSLS